MWELASKNWSPRAGSPPVIAVKDAKIGEFMGRFISAELRNARRRSLRHHLGRRRRPAPALRLPACRGRQRKGWTLFWG
ncbi:hypothetical protein RI054_32g127110 [Pseudoscourfieldia marina]